MSQNGEMLKLRHSLFSFFLSFQTNIAARTVKAMRSIYTRTRCLGRKIVPKRIQENSYTDSGLLNIVPPSPLFVSVRVPCKFNGGLQR